MLLYLVVSAEAEARKLNECHTNTRRNMKKISDLFGKKTSSPLLPENKIIEKVCPHFSVALLLRLKAEAICFPLPVAANQFPKRP